ncbi:immunoglobulin domain-containing protein [Haloferula sargassicola]
MKLRYRPFPALLGVFCCGLITHELTAVPLAYEGFDYPEGFDTLSGQNGGIGWSGPWITVNNGTGDVEPGSLTAGSHAAPGYDSRSSGNHCALINSRRVGRALDVSSTGPFAAAGLVDGSNRIGADGTTVYVSFTQQPNGTSKYYEFEFHRGNLGDPGRIAGIGNDQGGDNVNLRAPNGTHTLIGTGSTEVNFYIVRIDFKPGNDDVYVYRNPGSVSEPATATLTRLGAADMSFDGISFGAFDNDRTVAHDEVRLGLSWEEVAAPADVAPVITQQPAATVTGYEGSSVKLTAGTFGLPAPSLQWSKNGEVLPGQTASSLVLENLAAASEGNYTLTATNGAGSVTTDAANLTVLAAPPGLLAYDGFAYPSGTLPGDRGGLGWNGDWAAVNGAGGLVVDGSLSAGANAPDGLDDESTGNASRVLNQQRAGRYLDTSPGGVFDAAGFLDADGNVGADGKTLYISFLQQPDGTSLFYEFEFHRDDLGDPGRIGGVGNDTNLPVVGLRTGGTTTTIGPGSTGVNFYVLRIDFQPGDDDVYVYQNPVSATEPGIPTLSKIAASDMSFNGLSMAAFVNGRTVKHDEIRIGQSWSDVVFGTSRRDLVWTGDGTANQWDFTSPNWSDGSSAVAFADGDPVTFDDSGSSVPDIDVTEDVSTGTLVVDNATNDYTFTGSGSIETSGGLEKTGDGELTLGVDLNSGSSLVVKGGTLTMAGSNQIGGELSLEAGTLAANLTGTSVFTGSMLAEEGDVSLEGTNSFAGLIGYHADFTLTGDTTITGGGVVWLGSGPGNSSNVTIQPGASLTVEGAINDSLVFGRDGGSSSVVQNGGVFTFNPTGHEYVFVGATNDPATVASYVLNDGLIDMPAKRLGIALGPIAATFTQNGGVLNARNLELGAFLTTGTGIFNLNGGEMNIGDMGITSASSLYEFNVGEAMIGALADWSSDIDMNLTGLGEDVEINTGEHTIELSGYIAGAGGILKTGEGTLAITGYNDFSGDTDITEGTLAGFGVSDFSPVTVRSGATLAPGVEGTGEFYCSQLTLESGSTYDVQLDREIELSDSVTVTGAMDISGANLVLHQIGSGLIPAGTKFTIIDYGGGTLQGSFAGLAQGASLTVGINTFSLSYSDSSRVTLTSTTVASPYDTWAAGNGLDGSPGHEAGFDEDPDGDDVANGLEWILGGDPLAGDGSSLLVATTPVEGGLQLDFARNADSLGLATLALEYDSDLEGEWTSVEIGAESANEANGVTVTVDDSGSPDAVSVAIPASNAADGKLFARLRAVMP